MAVLPLPPFGEKTVTTLPVAPFARRALAALRSANNNVSAGCGSTSDVRGADLEPGLDDPVRLAVGRKDERCAAKASRSLPISSAISPDDEETTWRATSTDEARRRPLPSVARTIDSAGWSARRRRELVRGRAAQQHPERRIVPVTVHRCSPGSFRRSGPEHREDHG